MMPHFFTSENKEVKEILNELIRIEKEVFNCKQALEYRKLNIVGTENGKIKVSIAINEDEDRETIQKLTQAIEERNKYWRRLKELGM